MHSYSITDLKAGSQPRAKDIWQADYMVASQKVIVLPITLAKVQVLGVNLFNEVIGC